MSDVATLTSCTSSNARRHETLWAVTAVVSAFGVYFCMYAFRKPFTAAGFGEAVANGTNLKTILVASQLAGYMLSKVLGIKVISEIVPHRRAGTILGLIAIAEVALVMFGLSHYPWNAVCLFVNGLALGMVFGLVLGFLEGRLVTEALVAGLCASFILADGFVKSVATWLLARGVSENWMPSVAGALFLAPLVLFTWMLSRFPPPHADDVAARSERTPLDRASRRKLLRRYAVGLTLVFVMYSAVTVLRSVRADYARELWISLGSPAQASTFTTSEIFVALGVMVASGCAICIRDNRRAFVMALATCAVGFVLIGAALVGLQTRAISGFLFMVVIGLGLYVPYVSIHTTVFERFLAMTRDRGNVGFLMYVADSAGYLGYLAALGMLSLLNSGGRALDPLRFFTIACWLTCGVSLVCLAFAWRALAGSSVQPAPVLAAATAVEGANT